LKFMPRGGFTINDVRDASALMAAMLTPGQGPRRYLPTGHHVSTREYVAVIEAATGRRFPTVFPPQWATLGLCRAVDVVQHVWPWHIPAEYPAAYMCYCDAHISDTMPSEPLDVKVRPLLETITTRSGGCMSMATSRQRKQAPPHDDRRRDGVDG
jgi:hypothetical protein